MVASLKPLYQHWLNAYPLGLLVTFVVGLIQVLVNGPGEDFLVGLFVLLTIAIATVASLTVSVLSGKFGTTGLTLILPAIIAVLFTARILTYSSNSSFTTISGYGFPLPWWQTTNGPYYQSPVTGYNGFFFMLDTLFFTIMGYLIITTYIRLTDTRRQRSKLS